MRTRTSAVCLLGSLSLACLGAPSIAAAQVPIEIYGADPAVSDVEISPDGTRIAMINVVAGKSRLSILELANPERGTGFDVSDIKVRDVDWSGPNSVLLYMSQTANLAAFRTSLIEFGAVFSIDISGKNPPVQLLAKNRQLGLNSSLSDVRASAWNERGDVYMAAFGGRNSSFVGQRDLYLVDGKTGRGKIIAKGTESTRSWIVSPKGYVVARVDHFQKSDRYRIVVPESKDRLGSPWRTVFSEETEIPNFSVYGANTDETALIVGTTVKTGRYGLFEMSLADGSLGGALFEHGVVDVNRGIVDPYSGAIIGASYVLDSTEQQFFVNDLQAVLVGVRKAFPGQRVTLRSWDRDRRRIVFRTEGPGNPGSFKIIDLDRQSVINIQGERPELQESDIAPTSSFFYNARDGMPIHAFLTLPPGAEGKNLPMVVLPHGGPAARDTASFDYWAQFAASRGYAVLKMNFRGSGGYGDGFEVAGYGEWGRKMQDDVTDGVKHVVAEGIADPNRICIVGGSYGGFAALAGAAFTPDLYRCAVSVNGVTDLAYMLAHERKTYGSDSSTAAYWEKSIGAVAKVSDPTGSRSPADAADAVTADVLLIHGKDDTVVPYRHSEIMHDALRKAGKSVELMTLKGEDHWLSKPETRIEMLGHLETFLDKHLGGATTAGN